jgi:hypothetical protein
MIRTADGGRQTALEDRAREALRSLEKTRSSVLDGLLPKIHSAHRK